MDAEALARAEQDPEFQKGLKKMKASVNFLTGQTMRALREQGVPADGQRVRQLIIQALDVIES